MHNFLELTEDQWITTLKTEEISSETLTCFASHIPDKAWSILATHQKLSENFILDFYYKFDMPHLIKHQRILEATVRNNLSIFLDHMWHVCRYQYLTEKFILDHKSQVNWRQIYLNQKHLSISFVRRTFKHYPRNEYIYNQTDVFNLDLYLKDSAAVNRIVLKHNERVKLISSVSRSISRS